jgi:arginase family enzyme
MGCRCQRLGEDNFDCQVNEINPDTAQRWEDLKNIGVHGTKISPENLIYFGVRDTEEAEKARLKKQTETIKWTKYVLEVYKHALRKH